MPPIVTDVWNALLVHPLISLLVLAYDFVPDFGLAVVIVTIAIRLALIPLFRQQLRSSRAMQELAPALNDIKKKYEKDRVRLQQEQMEILSLLKDAQQKHTEILEMLRQTDEVTRRPQPS